MKSLLVGLILSYICLADVGAQTSVHFSDPNLKAAVEAELWAIDPEADHMLGLTRLIACGREIADLVGLEYAANLITLELAFNRIRDISPVQGLDNLKKLVLNNNQINDISPVSGLVGLETLDVHNNRISDISAISGLTGLRTLLLRINQIRDISALSGLTNLETLILRTNEIADISALSGMTKLRILILSGNQIRDISSLSGLADLRTLTLSSNQISDISPLCTLTRLELLALGDNPLDEAAYDRYLPQIAANNPGVYLTYDARVTYELRVSSSAGGHVKDPGEGAFMYGDGEYAVVKVVADPGFVFVGWSGSYCSAGNPLSIPMGQDHTIRAHFESVLDRICVDDDGPGDPGAGDAALSDPYENGMREHPFDSIQEAIEVAAEGVAIHVRPGIYREMIDLPGKQIRLIGLAPDDDGRAAWPVIDGSGTGPVVRFSGDEGRACTMMGFVITGDCGQSAGAIYCSSASPTIANCLIVGTRASGWNGAAVCCKNSRAVFAHCTIAHNCGGTEGAGMYLVDSHVTVVGSIVWGNQPREVLVNGSGELSMSYSDIAGGWPGLGTIADDPLFAQRGHWDPNGTPDDRRDDIWRDGDYHLKSQMGRWHAVARTWISDEMTSPCIDAGDPQSPVGFEPLPNGGLVNMGAYGGTAEASQSDSVQ